MVQIKQKFWFLATNTQGGFGVKRRMPILKITGSPLLTLVEGLWCCGAVSPPKGTLEPHQGAWHHGLHEIPGHFTSKPGNLPALYSPTLDVIGDSVLFYWQREVVQTIQFKGSNLSLMWFCSLLFVDEIKKNSQNDFTLIKGWIFVIFISVRLS